MRPIDKKQAGDTVSVLHANGTRSVEIIRQRYNPYSAAKPHLVAHLGEYCLYCENKVEEMNLAVEHIEPKALTQTKENPDYEHDWDNFLLACVMCNSHKNTQHYLPSDLHLPQNNNTYLSLSYLPGGIVQVNPALTGISKTHAENLLKMTGLGLYGTQVKSKDKRWLRRSEVWERATEDLQDYKGNKIGVDRVITDAEVNGFWSIWFTIFNGEDAVLSRLISDFKGTSASCFDANNHYQPIPRPSNAGKPDPI